MSHILDPSRAPLSSEWECEYCHSYNDDLSPACWNCNRRFIDGSIVKSIDEVCDDS